MIDLWYDKVQSTYFVMRSDVKSNQSLQKHFRGLVVAEQSVPESDINVIMSNYSKIWSWNVEVDDNIENTCWYNTIGKCLEVGSPRESERGS